jgi:hypothetical protein
VFAIDQQRPSDADRHLRDAEELLDIPGQPRRIKRELGYVLQLGTRLLAQEIAPRAQPRGCSRSPDRAGS